MLMRRARALYPGIHLYVVDGSAGQLDEWLSAGRVDVAVLFRHNESIPNGEHALAVVDAHLVSKPGDALTRNPTIDFVKLAGVPLILPGLPNGWRVAIERIATQKRIELSVVMESDSLPIIENVAAEGDAYAVLGSHVANRDVERGVLQSSAIVNPRIRLTVTLATTTAQPLTLACREVAMLIRRIFDELIAEGTLKVDLPDDKKSGARSGSRKVRLASAVRTGAGGTTG
jgi:DNA-binding transcriptional LysR family regulator